MHKELKPWAVKAKKYAMYTIVLIAIIAVYVGVKHSSKKVAQSQSIDQISMASPFNEEKVTTEVKLPLPDFDNPVGTGTPVKFKIMAWNAQFGLMYANGGSRTSKGSLMAKNGINCEIIRQDNCNISLKSFQDNAQKLADGKTTTPEILCIMGDGAMAMSSGLNAIRSFKHKAIIFDILGASRGEDGFWGPEDWRLHPENCLGKCVAGVAKDGDMNIVLKWCSDNKDQNGNPIKFNPDEKTWDSTALNIINCEDYNTDLCAKVLNRNYSEERDIKVSDGNGGAKTLTNTKHHCVVDAYTTWTPADVTIANKRGGFTRLASTAEYTMQMPCVAIIDANWAEANPDAIHGIIKAIGVAGDQVRSFPEAQEFAAKVSAKVYNEKGSDANYWLKYYRGTEEEDKKGNKVKLGGSIAFNISDAAMMLGMGNEATKVDRYKITYETFGAMLTKLYPNDMKGMTPYDEMVDKSYLKWVLDHNDSLKNGKSEKIQYASGATVTEQVSSEKFSDNGKGNTISFAVGKAKLNPSSYSVLDEIYNSAQISGGLTIFIYGHTDASGDPAANKILSEERANSVATYLKNKGLSSNRIQTRGYGSESPVYGSATDIRNRCVEIIQGK